MSQVTINTVIEGCEQMLEQSIHSIELSVKYKLAAAGLDSDMLRNIEETFAGVPRQLLRS